MANSLLFCHFAGMLVAGCLVAKVDLILTDYMLCCAHCNHGFVKSYLLFVTGCPLYTHTQTHRHTDTKQLLTIIGKLNHLTQFSKCNWTCAWSMWFLVLKASSDIPSQIQQWHDRCVVLGLPAWLACLSTIYHLEHIWSGSNTFPNLTSTKATDNVCHSKFEYEYITLVFMFVTLHYTALTLGLALK